MAPVDMPRAMDLNGVFAALDADDRFDCVYWHSNFVLAPDDYRYRGDHERAQHALALDFLKAGLLDRAEDMEELTDALLFRASGERIELCECGSDESRH